jgi:hypothetical protein
VEEGGGNGHGDSRSRWVWTETWGLRFSLLFFKPFIHNGMGLSSKDGDVLIIPILAFVFEVTLQVAKLLTFER